MNTMVMKKPIKDLNGGNIDIFNGATIIAMFFDKDNYRENHIPSELADWVPTRDKNYKVWWHSTNPSDPCDLGDDVLDYIEELPSDYKEVLIRKITERLSLLTLNRLFRILKSI